MPPTSGVKLGGLEASLYRVVYDILPIIHLIYLKEQIQPSAERTWTHVAFFQYFHHFYLFN
jgi:hypothetical protein